MMELGEKLKSHRENKGFSQVFVAEKLNVSRQSISKWENDRGYPDYDNLILLSQLYEVSIGELLDENEKLKKKLNIIMKILPARNRSSNFYEIRWEKMKVWF